MSTEDGSSAVAFDKSVYSTLESALKRAPVITEHVDAAVRVLQAVLAYSLAPAEHAHVLIYVTPRLVDVILKRGDLSHEQASHAHQILQLAINLAVRSVADSASPEAFLWSEILTPIFTDSSPLYARSAKIISDAHLYHQFHDDEARLTAALAAARAARDEAGDRWAFVPFTIWDGSVLLLRSMNHFGSVGGFAALAAAAANETVKFSTLALLCKPLLKAREFWVDTPMLALASDMFVPLRKRMLATAFESLKNDERQGVDDVRSALDSLYRRGSPAKAAEALRAFNLELALKFLASSSMPTRVQGAADVRDLIAVVAKQDRLRRQQERTKNVSLSNASAMAMLAYIRSNGLMEVFFGAASHMEIMRRGVEMLLFLAGQSALTDGDLDLVWCAGKGKHEAVEKVVLGALIDLVPVLSQARLDYLFGLVAAHPFAEYTSDTIQLVRVITQAGFGKNARSTALAVAATLTSLATGEATSEATGEATGEAAGEAASGASAPSTPSAAGSTRLPSEYGLPILWQLLQDNAPISESLAVAALQALTEILSWQCDHATRQVYMRRCVDNIRAHTAICASMMLLRLIVANYVATRQYQDYAVDADESMEAVIAWLVAETGVIDAVLDDMRFYRTAASARLATVRAAGSVPASTDEQIDALVLSGKQTHVQVYRERSQLLGWLLTHGRIDLSEAQFDTYWDCAIAAPISQTEQCEGFIFLERTCSVADSFSDATVRYIFLQKSQELSFTALQSQGYAFYEYFFRYINWKEKRFEQKANQAMTVLSEDLLGLDGIWRVCFESLDKKVFESASAFLLRLYQSLAPSLFAAVGAKREEYVRYCLDALGTGAAAAMRVERALALLRMFLAEFAAPYSAKRTPLKPHGLMDTGRPFVVQVLFDSARGPAAGSPGQSAVLEVSSACLLGELRARIGARMRPPEQPFNVRLALDGASAELASDACDARSLRDLDFDVLTILRASRLGGADADALSDLGAGGSQQLDDECSDGAGESAGLLDAGSLLTRDDVFDRLFGLLDALPAELAAQVWDLLMQLPTAASRADAVWGFALAEDEDPASALQTLLEPRSSFVLAYNLQIMRATVLDIAARDDRRRVLAERGLAANGQLTSAATDGASLGLNENPSPPCALTVPPAMHAAAERGMAWAMALCRYGGLASLVQLVLHLSDVLHRTAETPNQSALASQHRLALGLVLEVLNFFVLDASPYDGYVGCVTGATMGANGKAHLAEYIELETIVPRLLRVLQLAAGVTNLADSATANLAHQAVMLLVACLLADVLLINSLYSHEGFDRWFADVLLHSSFTAVRTRISCGFVHLCHMVASEAFAELLPQLPVAFFMRLCLAFLPQTQQYSSTCSDYFYLFVDLVRLIVASSSPPASPPSPSAAHAAAPPTLLGAGPAVAASIAPNVLGDLHARVLSMIASHPIIEERGVADAAVDACLVGLLNLCSALVSHMPELNRATPLEFIGAELFWACMFNTPTVDNHGPRAPPKCKSRAARAAGFELLVSLTLGSPEAYDLVSGLLLPHHAAHSADVGWQYVPALLEKSSSGFVGLENMGATCYMNALMQQLYMIPKLRFAVLSIDKSVALAAAPAPAPAPALALAPAAGGAVGPATSSERVLADSLLFQLQTLFGVLQESEKRYCPTEPFCLSYRDRDGLPMNPRIQMDADEFYLSLVDKLETLLRGSPQSQVLRDVFGGVITNEIICREGQHVFERQEASYALSLTIQHKKNVAEALDLYVQGDVLDGDNKYNCATCAKPVDALKRCCIKALPNTLLMHLKRFEFDFELLRRMKVDEVFEFPMSIDMRPWTQEGLLLSEALARATAEGQSPESVSAAHADKFRPDSYYRYELAGVVVHAGSADAGHYYSYIRDRASGEWYCFNDSSVERFDPADIPACCFGGQEYANVWDATARRMVPRLQAKVYSAYMLLYQRAEAYPPCSPFTEDAAATATATATATAKPLFSHSPEARVPLPRMEIPTKASAAALVPSEIYTSCWAANMRFLHEQHIFDADYFNFMGAVGRQPPASVPRKPDTQFDAGPRMLQLGLRFVFETLAHARECHSLGDWVAHLAAMFAAQPAGARWLLQHTLSDQRWVIEALFECTVPEVRLHLARLFAHAVSAVARDESAYLLDLDESAIDVAAQQGHARLAISATPTIVPASALAGADTGGGVTDDVAETTDWATAQAKVRYEPGPDFAGDGALAPHFAGQPRSLAARWLDALLGHLGGASQHWRSFGQYFGVFSALAAAGPIERSLLASRAVLARLVSFALEEQSPYFVGSLAPPSPSSSAEASSGAAAKAYRPMGDKLKAPQFDFLLAAVALLVRATHGEDGPAAPDQRAPSTLAGDTRPLSVVETSLLLDSPFFLRAFVQGWPCSAISDILTHLCWGSQRMSRVCVGLLVQALVAAPLEAYEHVYNAAGALCELSDAWQGGRVAELLLGIVQEVSTKRNHRPEAVMSLRRLTVLVTNCPAARAWFFSQRHLWLVDWLADSVSETVRDEAESFVTALVPQLHSAYLDAARQRETLSSALMVAPLSTAELSAQLSEIDEDRAVRLDRVGLSDASLAATRDLLGFLLSQFGTLSRFLPAKGVPVKSPGTGTGALVVLLRLARTLVSASLEHKLLVGVHFPALWDLFLAIDSLRLDLDRNKKALTEFWLEAFDGVPANVSLLLASPELPRLVSPMLNFYVIALNDERYLEYNRPALTTFFKLVHVFASQSRAFRDLAAPHVNWEWMLCNIVLATPDYAAAAEAMMSTIRLQAADSPTFRTKWLTYALTQASVRTSPAAVLALFEAVVVEPNELQAFIAGGGVASVLGWLAVYDADGDTQAQRSAAVECLRRAVRLLRRVLDGPGLRADSLAPDGAAAEAGVGAVLRCLAVTADPADRASLYKLADDLAALAPLLAEALVGHLAREHELVVAAEAAARRQALQVDYSECRIIARRTQLHGFGRGRALYLMGGLKDVAMGDRPAVAATVSAYYSFVLGAVRRVLNEASASERAVCNAVRLVCLLLVDTIHIPLHRELIELARSLYAAPPGPASQAMRGEARLDEYIVLVLYAEPAMLASPHVSGLCRDGLVACQRRSEAGEDGSFGLLAQLVMERVDRATQDYAAYVRTGDDNEADSAARVLADGLRALDVLCEAPALRENVSFAGGLFDAVGSLLADEATVHALELCADGEFIAAWARAHASPQ